MCSKILSNPILHSTRQKIAVIVQTFFHFFFILISIGKFSHDIDTGHLFVPRRVHANGTHLSYNVTHFHDFSNLNEIDNDQIDKLHYHIDLHDQTLHIELK